MSSCIKLSLEEVEKLNGTICMNLLSTMEEEFKRRAYLMERYTRSKDMAIVRNTPDVTNMDVICAYEKYVVDVSSGYIMGTPVSYYNRNRKEEVKVKTTNGKEKVFLKDRVDKETASEESEELYKLYMEIARENGDTAENFEVTQNTFIKRYAYEYVYTNENGEIRYKLLDGDCVAIKSDDIEEKIIGFLRKYQKSRVVFDGQYTPQNYTIIELWTPFKRVWYSSEDGFTKEHNLMREGTKPFTPDMEIPIVEYSMCQGIGLFEQQISQIRGYELVTNNSKKTLNYNDAAILMISGAMFLNQDDENERKRILEEYVNSGVLLVDGEDGAGASWLKKDINDGAVENHKKNLKNDIFSITGLFNPENDNMVYQNTLSLMFKLYGLETKMSEFVEMFRKALKRRIKIICEIVNKRDGKNYDWRDIEMTFYRNLPTNTQEEMNILNQLWGKLPIKKLYDMMSFVEDSEEMVKEYRDYRIWEAELEAEIAEKLSKATEEDVNPDGIDSYNENDYQNTEDESNDETEENDIDSQNQDGEIGENS